MLYKYLKEQENCYKVQNHQVSWNCVQKWCPRKLDDEVM